MCAAYVCPRENEGLKLQQKNVLVCQKYRMEVYVALLKQNYDKKLNMKPSVLLEKLLKDSHAPPALRLPSRP